MEMDQHDEYETFTDREKDGKIDGYKKIRVHLIYAVKHDGRHKPDSSPTGTSPMYLSTASTPA
jgi:hypothetical protein